jgi:hypothetical protein
MKIKKLIQYRSRPGITSYGYKIEDMSCYKILLTTKNKPPKAEYEMNIQIQKMLGLCPAP